MGTGVPSSLLPPVHLHIQAVPLDTVYIIIVRKACQYFFTSFFGHLSICVPYPTSLVLSIPRNRGFLKLQGEQARDAIATHRDPIDNLGLHHRQAVMGYHDKLCTLGKAL
jgi:hypothetical protein